MHDDELIEIIDAAIERYQGHSDLLRNAVGAVLIGRLVGWKPLLLMQNKRTVDRYGQILGVDLREILPEVGLRANKSLAWRVVQAGQKFWDVVKARVPGRSPVLA
jgi:hypothetical protein